MEIAEYFSTKPSGSARPLDDTSGRSTGRAGGTKMASQFGPIEIDCDAPPYGIVEACDRIGFRSPLDVPWYRLSHFLGGEGSQGGGVFSLQLWKHLLGLDRSGTKTCRCGQLLPALEKCTFTFLSSKQADYLIGQCRDCLTIFWDKA
jgi:hypothetical protein